MRVRGRQRVAVAAPGKNSPPLQSVPIPRRARRVATTAAPPFLLAHLKELPPYHEATLLTPFIQAKPTSVQREPAQEYVAFCAQLRADIRKDRGLLDPGYALAMRQLATWQAVFWRAISNRWEKIWEVLGVERKGAAISDAGKIFRVEGAGQRSGSVSPIPPCGCPPVQHDPQPTHSRAASPSPRTRPVPVAANVPGGLDDIQGCAQEPALPLARQVQCGPVISLWKPHC